MKEDFLHYLWTYQLFDISKLTTVKKEPISVLKVGLHNHNSGPDFLNAKLEIDSQLWFGNIEIHVKSSDWYLHQHESDKNYDAVILHVVWEFDEWDLVGNGLACWQILDAGQSSLVRKQLKELKK